MALPAFAGHGRRVGEIGTHRGRQRFGQMASVVSLSWTAKSLPLRAASQMLAAVAAKPAHAGSVGSRQLPGVALLVARALVAAVVDAVVDVVELTAVGSLHVRQSTGHPSLSLSPNRLLLHRDAG